MVVRKCQSGDLAGYGMLEALLSAFAVLQADTWGAYATCPEGYLAIGLARVDLQDQVATDKQDVSDFECLARDAMLLHMQCTPLRRLCTPLHAVDYSPCGSLT